MRRAREPRIETVRTTTISVTKPTTFESLADQFRLVRYVVPDRLRNDRNGRIFQRVHAQIREQLDHPYRSYQYDKLDGPERWAVYALYPKTVQQLDLHVDDVLLEWREVEFAEPAFHLLLKLLQVQYFREGEQQGTFVGCDSCYVYARRDGKNAYICMEIELKGSLANKEEQPTQLFTVIGSAHKFVRSTRAVEPGREYANPYYAISRISGEGMAFFQRVKPSQVVELSRRGGIYEQRTFEGRRATLGYYLPDAVERSRGYLLDTFIGGFTSFLANYGIGVQSVERQFIEFTPTPDVTDYELPLKMLKVVSLYDVRKQRSIPIDHYLTLFKKAFSDIDIKFQALTELTDEFDGVLLFIMDFAPEAFEEGMPLYGEQDPYQALYQRYPHIPKQGLNVNSNDLEEAEAHEGDPSWYLSYSLLDMADKNIRNRVAVSLNQLFLKDVVIRRGQPISHRLPCIQSDYIFVRKRTRNRVPYEIALYFDNGGSIQFLDLGDPDQQATFSAQLQSIGVDWDTNYQAMLTRYRKDKEAKLTRYDLIIGPDLFVEIEDLNERVLYEFDEVTERQAKRKLSLPLADFRLSSRYDDLRLEAMLSKSELLRLQFIDSNGTVLRSGQTKQQSQSLEFWMALQQYDVVLDEMQLQYLEISFEDLYSDKYWFPRIAQAFGKQPDGEGRYQTRFFKDLYRRIGIFPSIREGTLTPTYQGIWYDDEYRFIVGDTNPLKLTGQAKAHLVRQFITYQRNDRFQIAPFLDATSVRFVRLNQFTVHPYFFHLIDLYIENVLQHTVVE